MLTPESFPPPPTALYPVRKPALQISGSGLRADLWNGEETLRFSVYGRREKWIELGNQGAGSIPYTLEVQEGRTGSTYPRRKGHCRPSSGFWLRYRSPQPMPANADSSSSVITETALSSLLRWRLKPLRPFRRASPDILKQTAMYLFRLRAISTAWMQRTTPGLFSRLG